MTVLSEKTALRGRKYKAYPEYKDSGVFWLDKIPCDWTVNTVKRLTDFQVGWTPSTGKDENFVGENLWANISDLKDKYLYDTAKKISDEAARVASMAISPNGSLLFSFKLSVGSVSFAKQDMYTNEAIASFLATSKLPLEYLYYALPKFIVENASTNIYGAKILNQELIRNAFLLEPSYDEAVKIANFLDHETAKIDTLIESQEKLIALLKEKRQAVISHAVTKGLDQNGNLRKSPKCLPAEGWKDSGVEWLGEVPEHWETKRLKYLVKEPLLYGANEAAEDIDKSQPRFIRITDVKADGALKEDTFRSLPHKTALPYMLSDGDILLARSGGTVGKSFIYRDSWGKCCFAGYLIKASINEDIIDANWVYLNTLTNFYWDWIKSSQIQATIQNVSADKYNSFEIAIPPENEVIDILSYLKMSLEKFDYLTVKAEQAIELIKERKTALISAAVTGKIDVRAWQPTKTFSNSADTVCAIGQE